MKKDSKKFFTGTFEITDSKGAFSITAFVEAEKNIKPFFWVNISHFDGTPVASMAFSSIELRSLANYLKRSHYDNMEAFEKKGGGKKLTSTLQVEQGDKYFKIVMLIEGVNHSVSILSLQIEALADEILLLLEECVKNCYKTQQYVERKHKDKNID
jgi:hypothetical protein